MTNDEETEGFLTPARADAIAANFVDVRYVEVGYGKLRSFPPEPPEFPTGVTLENWPELRAAGWQWLTNLTWPFVNHPLLRNESPVFEGIKVRHGEANVLLGLPGEKRGPIAGQWTGQWQVGVYVLENLELPEAVRKFIAEHEEKP